MSSDNSLKRGRALWPQGFMVLLALLVAQPLSAAPDRVLQAIDFTTLPGDKVSVILTLSEAAPEPSVFATDDPARLAIDLIDTKNALPRRLQRIDVGNARSVAVAESADRTRVVVELSEMAPYNVRTDANRVIVDLESPAAAAASGSASSASISGMAGRDRPRIENIDFRRGEQGEGRIIALLSDPSVSIDVREEAGKVVVEFKNTDVPDEFLRRLDVLDFATPVKFVDTVREGINTRILVTSTASSIYEQVAYQAGNTFTLELQPLSLDEQERRSRLEPTYIGERITLNFQDVEVRSILQIIADVAGKNLVASDAVTGTVALRLENVPWDQALDIILKTKGLGKREEGNVMLVGTLSEIAAREKAEVDARAQREELAPLRSELLQVNYAKASTLAALIQSSESSLLSDRGSVAVDERTNTLLLNDSRDKLSDIRALIARLDVPVRQVLIESRIVIANDDFSRDLGVRAGVSAIRAQDDNVLVTSGSLASVDGPLQSLLGGTTANLGGSFASAPESNATPQFGRYNINLPIAAPTAQVALGILGADYLVDLELGAAQAEGRGELVSTPRVITANGKEARIEQGVEIPYQQSSSSGATTVAFKKAVLSLMVTPQITPDERVIMDLEVKNDSVGQVVSDAGGGNVPSIDTREVTTQVLVNNGETVVLGGVYVQTRRENETKVPLLGDVPLLGYLFRQRSMENSKSELLIFVTPKILSEGIQLN